MHRSRRRRVSGRSAVVAVLALVAAAALADGFTDAAGWFDVGVASDRKREALSRRLKRGRPRWERTAPDHADEPALLDELASHIPRDRRKAIRERKTVAELRWAGYFTFCLRYRRWAVSS